jgi:serine protease AprX
MATPFVAGAVALALQARTMPPAELRQLLEASAQDRGPAGKDNEFGAGLLDVNALVARAKGVASPPSTAFPAYRRITGSVGTHGQWNYSFALGAADLGIPIGATLTIAGQVKCSLELFGLCLAEQWDPDLEARLLDPNGVLLAESTCLAGSECGVMGRQETLHAMPTVAGTYTIQVYPAEDSGNMGKGGAFALDLSTGPVGGAPAGGPAVHVGGLQSTATGNKTGWQASVKITLHDANHLLLTLPAVVTGTWSGGYSGSSSCSTSTGQCTVTSGTISKRKTTATFTVNNVSGNVAYQPASNHPTSITVVKP